MKKIPRIKFPQRHPKPSGTTSHHQESTADKDQVLNIFSRTPSMSPGGRAADQPKKDPSVSRGD